MFRVEKVVVDKTAKAQKINDLNNKSNINTLSLKQNIEKSNIKQGFYKTETSKLKDIELKKQAWDNIIIYEKKYGQYKEVDIKKIPLTVSVAKKDNIQNQRQVSKKNQPEVKNNGNNDESAVQKDNKQFVKKNSVDYQGRNEISKLEKSVALVESKCYVVANIELKQNIKPKLIILRRTNGEFYGVLNEDDSILFYNELMSFLDEKAVGNHLMLLQNVVDIMGNYKYVISRGVFTGGIVDALGFKCQSVEVNRVKGAPIINEKEVLKKQFHFANDFMDIKEKYPVLYIMLTQININLGKNLHVKQKSFDEIRLEINEIRKQYTNLFKEEKRIFYDNPSLSSIGHTFNRFKFKKIEDMPVVKNVNGFYHGGTINNPNAVDQSQFMSVGLQSLVEDGQFIAGMSYQKMQDSKQTEKVISKANIFVGGKDVYNINSANIFLDFTGQYTNILMVDESGEGGIFFKE